MSGTAKSLLAKAKAVPVKGGSTFTVDLEILEAAVAWMRGEVTTSQVAAAWGVKSWAAHSKLVMELGNAVKSGKLKLEIVP